MRGETYRIFWKVPLIWVIRVILGNRYTRCLGKLYGVFSVLPKKDQITQIHLDFQTFLA